VTLNPNGKIQVCLDDSSKLHKISPIHLTCEIGAPNLVWLFSSVKNDTSEITRFVHGGLNLPVDMTSGVWAVLTSHSEKRMTSNLTVHLTKALIPFEVSCGVNLNKYSTFSLSYKG